MIHLQFDAAHIASSANYFAKAQALSQLEGVGMRNTDHPRCSWESPANGHPMRADSLERVGGRPARIVNPTLPGRLRHRVTDAFRGDNP